MNFIRKLIPYFLINWGKHLPEAIWANLRFSFPGRKLRVIGVTGTDGKTTTVNMVYQILKRAGKSVSMISTINAHIAGKSYDTGFHVTSPDPADVQRFLKTALEEKDEFMVLEVTSHALAQFRVWGVKFEIGVITNITHEHLDYHGNFENYLKTKAKLTQGVKFAILNYDDPSFAKLIKTTSGKIISFGLNKKADINPQNFPLKLKIPGQYNISNALAAAGVGVALGIDKGEIKNALENFTSLPGRMEEIKNNQGIKIVVDFAHTPHALEEALKTLRKETSGRLIAVFGAAGARDKAKRPMMGKIAGRLADIVILTDEDPRFEDREVIIEEIAQGVCKEKLELGKNLFKEPDRSSAIVLGINLAQKGDLVGIFGKGHERSMNYQGKEFPWSDQKAAQKAILRRKQKV